MIEYKKGDILGEDVEALVNTVNCVGVMGRGIALQFKNNFPDNFRIYAAACKKGIVQPGKMFVFESYRITNPKYIINFPTKRHWRGKSRLEDIKTGLRSLTEEIRVRNIRSIAIPPLGSGLGGLEWNSVKTLIEAALSKIEGLDVIIYEPAGAPEANTMAHSSEVPSMTKGRAALVALMQRYLNGLMDPFVTLLEVHKLMYFMQETGEPLQLKYNKAVYGPFAENLSHVLKKIEGHFVSGYADGGDAPDKELTLVPGSIEDAVKFLESTPVTKAHIERVADLVEGFETPFGLELLSTVHWVATNMNAHTIEDVVSKTYEWNERKRQFTERQIKVAYMVLQQKGWLN
ncbi:MAG: macro domain-containing protein [Nitrospinota bacterium]|nr:macro domain-containing protein [Nitrospinota bacterium]